MNLPDPALRLRAAPGLSLELENDGSVAVGLDGECFTCGPHTLAVIDAFSRPRVLADALETLSGRCSGAQDWVDMTQTVARLHAWGALLEDDAQGLAGGARSFGAPPLHVQMLDDRHRTGEFIRAVGAVVRPGSVVVDLGTGTGVLALAALRAGAGRVYALEAGDMAESAAAMFRAAGAGDRVRLVRDWSARASLPEAGDLLIAEIVGHDPFGEGILEQTLDARRRLLRPGAAVIPAAVEPVLLPVRLPGRVLDQHTFTAANTSDWTRQYGFDFSPLVDSGASAWGFYAWPDQAHCWSAPCAPVSLPAVRLAELETSTLELEAEVTVARTTRVDAVLLAFRLDLGDGPPLATVPGEAHSDCHWRCPVHLLAAPVRVRKGERLRLTYRYRRAAPRVELSRATRR